MDVKYKDPVKIALKDRLIGLLRKPQAEERRPANRLWIAFVGFNLIMAALDVVSAVTVAAETSALYGLITFLAGILALLLHEQLFSNPHANTLQKNLAIGGGILAIVSTVGIGMLAGAVNVLNLASLVSVQTLELWMIIGMVIIAGAHGMIYGIYYYIDDTHRAQMRYVANQAYREQQRRNIEAAKADVAAVKSINAEIESMGEDAPLLQEAYREGTGRDLLHIPAELPFLPRQYQSDAGGSSFRSDEQM